MYSVCSKKKKQEGPTYTEHKKKQQEGGSGACLAVDDTLADLLAPTEAPVFIRSSRLALKLEIVPTLRDKSIVQAFEWDQRAVPTCISRVHIALDN